MFALSALGACGGLVEPTGVGGGDYVEGPNAAPDDTPLVVDPNANPGEPGSPAADDSLPCDTVADAAEQVMATYCVGCHGDTGAVGGFARALDVGSMISDGMVTPGDPTNSRVVVRVNSNTMPPVGVFPRPSAVDLGTLESWILCGAPDWNGGSAPVAPPTDPVAPADYLGFDDKVRDMLRDVRSFANPADRPFIRYLDLTGLANAGASSDQLELYRQALAFQVNSLSIGLQLSVPEPINESRTIYRINMEDYGWTPEIWDRIASVYPYAVEYNADSRVFPLDQTTADLLRDELDTGLPFVDAEWFLATVSEAPLYYDILGFADNLDDFAGDLGINIQNNIDALQVMRVGIASSGVALNRNRATERHALFNNQGAFWISYDFFNNLGESNIFEEPLDFAHDGSEVIHNLPNGMQAYSIWEADGTRINEAPTSLVADPNDPLGTVSPQQCAVCHGFNGLIPQSDSVRAYALGALSAGQDKETVLALYPEQSVIDDITRRDSLVYRTALERAGVNQDMAIGMNRVLRSYESAVTAVRAAGLFGIPLQDLLLALNSDPAAFPAEVSVLRREGGVLHLDGFLNAYGDTVRALGLGIHDECPADVDKNDPGQCGCGVSDVDTDGDGTADCVDACELDPGKLEPGVCGCGVADDDTDGDGTEDCLDPCFEDPNKIEEGVCGCGVADVDTDFDGALDCQDECFADPAKVDAGICGCGVSDIDSDGDGTADCFDGCDDDPNKTAAGICGCGVSDVDSDGDGTADCFDGCDDDPNKTAAGICGCGVSDVDSDGDGTADCFDLCASDPNKTSPGSCGCGFSEQSCATF